MDSIKYCDTKTALEEAFPELLPVIKESNYYEDLGSYIVYENVFAPYVLDAIKRRNPELTGRIFDFLEELAKSDDIETNNLLQVGLLENIWDNCDRDSYVYALTNMGSKTKMINSELSSYMLEP